MNILLTSVGRRSYLVEYFKDALKDIGLVHAGNSHYTYATKIADKGIITPAIYDNSYIEFLVDYCLKNEISALISLFDIDLPVLAKHREIFESKGIQLVISDFEVTQICNDKWLAFQFFKKKGFATPLTFIDIKKSIRAIEKGEMDYPLIIKPRWGMGSIGIFEADNIEELEILYAKTKREIEKSYLKYESSVDIDRAILIQERVEGEEYGVDVFNDLNKNYICTVPKKKIAMRAGETDSAEIIESPELIGLGKKLSENLRHMGNLDVDIFLVKNVWYILEMNPRFGGQYPFSHVAGVNFPKMIVDMLRGFPIDPGDYNFEYNIRGFKDISIKVFD